MKETSTQRIDNNITLKLLDILAELLDIHKEDLEENTNIREFGLDSVALNEFAEVINKTFDIEIDSTLLFEYSTIKEIGNYLTKEYAGSMAGQLSSADEESMDRQETGLEEMLISILSGLLNISSEEIDELTDLRDFGLDSVALNDFAELINLKSGTAIDAALLFEYTNVKEIAAYLRQDMYIAPDVEEESTGKTETDVLGPVKSLEELFPAVPVKEPSPEPGQSYSSKDIAIIGISGRMPQSDDLNEFWRHIENNDDLITDIPKDRWDWREYKANNHRGGFLKNIRRFDAGFFNISPREAEMMDPQQRLLLEEVWHLFEDAGYKASDLSGSRTGVFIGAGNDDYNELIAKSNLNIDSYAATGTYLSILSNRISYIFNLFGPSMTIDTACSSSLFAVHQAVMSLNQDECEMAIAGGVNIICDPRPYLSFSHAGMLSGDGRCKTFDSDADGYVRAEGVGVILLKPFKKAVEEGRHIYGVIKGSAINHNGMTNSLTAPSPNAQADVIMRAMKKGDMKPGTISYIEAHGTGTSLGDPIEINGLKKAFKELADSQGTVLNHTYCGISSVKTNMGHSELASGMAGIFKVLLAMKHKVIPGVINYHKTNDLIHLEDSPFYIVDTNKEWVPLKDNEGNAIPRRAGINSFGFGGANAHVVIEEYINHEYLKEPKAGNYLFVLSARDEERLKVYARQMLEYIKDKKLDADQLTNMAYTLQTGREAMRQRLAVSANSAEDLIVKISMFLSGEENKDIFHGDTKTNKRIISVLQNDKEFEDVINLWSKQKKVEKILNFWVMGLNINWNNFYKQISAPHIISLPAYPFSESSYWLPKEEKTSEKLPVAGAFHPLLHKNISNFKAQKFQTVFSGEEFFLTAHVIHGQKILPGVAYLEMALAAFKYSSDDESDGILAMRDIVWLKPIYVNSKSEEAVISLTPDDEENVRYQIYSGDHICCEGDISYKKDLEEHGIDIENMLTHNLIKSITKEECYSEYKKKGYHYGKEQQGIECLYITEQEVIAKLSLPKSVEQTRDEYILHPSLLDSAIQATIGFLMDEEKMGNKTYVPFNLGELLLFDDKPEVEWAVLRDRSEPDNLGGIKRFDIELCDSEGNICVQMQGLVLREYSHSGASIFTADWSVKKPVPGEIIKFNQYTGVFCNIPEETRDKVRDKIDRTYDFTTYYTFESKEDEIVDKYEEYTDSLIQNLKQMLLDNRDRNNMIQIFVPANGIGELFAGFSGLLKTVELENPRLKGQIIYLDYNKATDEVIDSIVSDSKYPADKEIRYDFEQRRVKSWGEIRLPSKAVIPWKDHGIYLISGGSGKLGLLFAEEIAKKVKNPVLILVGRKQSNDEICGKVKLLNKLGAEAHYKQIDITDGAEVHRRMKEIMKSYGGLDGVLHCAGLINDNLLYNKTSNEIQKVLEPKIRGLVNLDHSTSDVELDFFILYSSIAGALGNIGQSDYAAANAFMDVYSKYRNTLVREGKRFGRTISINWPLWKDGGMHMNGEAQKDFYKKTGIDSLAASDGINALYSIFGLDCNQAMAVSGNIEKIKKFLNITAENTVEECRDDERMEPEDRVVTDILEGNMSEEEFLGFLERSN